MTQFIASHKRSIQPRKQRKYRYDAPLHIRKKFVHAHLTKELRDKYKIRNIQLRKEDRVKILRGQFKGKSGVVDKIDLKRGKAVITGIDITKKDGSKVPYAITVSNLIITELKLEDKKRNKSIERKK